MSNSASRTAYQVCLAGTVLLTLLAFYQFSVPASTKGAWFLALGAIVFAIAAAQARHASIAAQRTMTALSEQAEAARFSLEKQGDAIDSLADGLDVAVFVCNSKGVIQYANRRASEMFRMENPVGRSLLSMTLNYGLEQLTLDAIQSRSSTSAELTFAYPVERVGIAKAWLSDVNVEQAFVSIYEITDLRRLERIRQDFVSNVSHELRTPLTIIRSMTETLLDDPVPDAALAAKYLPRIISEVDRLSMISNDLLILSASESNPVRKSTCDVAELFRGVLEQLASKAKEKGIETTFSGPPHLVVEANPAQMTQVALNLVDNAINYTNQGKIAVEVSEEAGNALIKVSDTGLGIASEHVPRIFERFYRVDKARSRHSGGTGLGLSIVKHIIGSHGGDVNVESALGEGSTFTVRIPVGVPHTDPED